MNNFFHKRIYMAIRYSVIYDSLYDDKTLEWIEEQCNDPTCEFCAYRPDKPEFSSKDRIYDGNRRQESV